MWVDKDRLQQDEERVKVQKSTNNLFIEGGKKWNRVVIVKWARDEGRTLGDLFVLNMLETWKCLNVNGKETVDRERGKDTTK